MAPASEKKERRAKPVQFIVDCTRPVEDGIMDAAQFEKFLHDKFKVEGKAGNLGERVTITREKTRIVVKSTEPFAKRYLKYLTKKFLKKQQLRDFLRVLATSRNAYELRYFTIDESAADEEGEGE